MARIIESKFTPLLTAVIQTVKEDGSVLTKELKHDDVVTALRYVENGDISEVTGRIDGFDYSINRKTRNFSKPNRSTSGFASDVILKNLIVDSSEVYKSIINTIPAREIVEDDGVTDVERMKFFLKYGVHCWIELSDGTINEFDLYEGQELVDLEYLNNGRESLISGKLVAILYTGEFVPTDVVINANGSMKTIDIDRLRSLGDSAVPIDTSVSVTEAISASSGIVALSAGTYSGEITVEKDVTICGARAGISASDLSIKRDKSEETVISGKLNVPAGQTLTLNGVTITEDALISISANENVTIENCIVEEVAPTVQKTMLISTQKDVGRKLVVKNCYFAKNPSNETGDIYHIIDTYGVLLDGSEISNNYFEEGSSIHNSISIYEVAENATITIANNVWEKSANGIRLGIKGDTTCTINITDNHYKTTDVPEWEGLLIIQPYGKETTSMANVTVNLNGNTSDCGGRLWYLYTNDTDPQFTESNVPTIVVDGEVELAPVKA